MPKERTKYDEAVRDLMYWCKKHDAVIEESCGYVMLSFGGGKSMATSSINGKATMIDDDTSHIIQL